MKRTFVIAAGLVVAGCSNFPSIPYLNEEDRSKTVISDEESAGRAVDSALVAGDGSANQQLTMRIAPAPKRKPTLNPVVRIEPKTLVGLTRSEVRDMMGAPVTIADSPPSTVWSYRAKGCALDVFFYLDVGSKTFRALTFDLKSGTKKGAISSTCLGKIKAAGNGG
jgi:hypothetical protein